MNMKIAGVKDNERKKPVFPRIFDESQLLKSKSLTKREENICLGSIKVAVSDATHCILRYRSKYETAEIAQLVQNHMINCLARLDYQKLVGRPKLGKDGRNDND